jgi:tetratricopeptide (TPR) repeat protein
VHYENGSTLFDSARYEEALAEFDRAVRLDQSNPLYHLQKGIALWKLEDYQERPEAKARYSHASKDEFRLSLTLYREVIRREPNEAAHHYNIARALANLDLEKDSLREVEQAVRLAPEVAQYHWFKAHVLSDLSRTGEAISEVDKTLNLAPTLGDGYILKANLYADIGSRNEATKVLNDALLTLENDDKALSEFFNSLSDDVGSETLNEKRRSVLEPFFFKEMLGVARQLKPSELLR